MTFLNVEFFDENYFPITLIYTIIYGFRVNHSIKPRDNVSVVNHVSGIENL